MQETGPRSVISDGIEPAAGFAQQRSPFIPAVVGFFAVFATVGVTIPLFNIYRAEDGFTNLDISLSVVIYSAATLLTLLVFGRLSHHVGRKPVGIAALLLLVAGAVVLLDVHYVAVLVVGRSMMGLGAGLASSSLTAYIVDSAPRKPTWLASVASSQTVMLGLAIGAVASGALIQFAPWPRDLTFILVIVLLLASAAWIAASPETAPRTPGALRSLRPRVSVPAQVRHLVPVAAAVIVATWATGSFYQAFVPGIVEGQLHTKSPLVLGLVFAAYMAPSALGAPISGRFSPAVGQRLGMVGFLVGMIGAITAITTDTLALFIVATVVAGASQGIATSATTRGLLHGSRVHDRAPIFSAIYLLSYAGATIPALIAGQLTGIFTLSQIAIGYGVLALVATAITALAARNPRD
ncbi:MFS transporter [Humibacter soli]